MSPLREVIKESYPSALVTTGVTLTVWCVIIGSFGVKTIYQEHDSSVRAMAPAPGNVNGSRKYDHRSSLM
ncbi:MAG TPA: hypothetical protein VLX29_05305 [Nitrospirota bacterium]|nr:hypothetical protein [Nitrospirota bacterium]